MKDIKSSNLRVPNLLYNVILRSLERKGPIPKKPSICKFLTCYQTWSEWIFQFSNRTYLVHWVVRGFLTCYLTTNVILKSLVRKALFQINPRSTSSSPVTKRDINEPFIFQTVDIWFIGWSADVTLWSHY